jgi:hypothetical protein
MARDIFFSGFQGQISSSLEPQVNQVFKQGLAQYNVAVVPANPFQLLVFRDSAYKFDNGGIAVTRKVVIHPHNARNMREFAAQVYQSPQGTVTVYFAPTDPDILMVGPPPAPLTSQRLGGALVNALNLQGDGVTLGPVRQQIVGDKLLQLLTPLNVPQNPSSLLVGLQLAQIGNGGHSLALLGDVVFDEVFLPYWFSIEIDDDGTVSGTAQRLIELPYPKMNSPQTFPFTGLPEIFYTPLP